MTKFHITTNDMPGKCTATKRACPLGGADEHFDSLVDAAKAIEARAKEQEVPAAVKKPQSYETRSNNIVESLDVPRDFKTAMKENLGEIEPEMKALVAAEDAVESMPPGAERRTAQREVSAAEVKLVRATAEVMSEMTDIPESIRDRVWRKAWEDEHSAGYGQVVDTYEEQADLIKTVFEAGQAQAASRYREVAKALKG